MKKFPFEKHVCSFMMVIETANNHTVHFVEDTPAIVYQGPSILNEYELEAWETSTNLSHTMTSFMFSFTISRLYFIQLITTFFQTFLLWLLAYFTLYFDMINFRFVPIGKFILKIRKCGGFVTIYLMLVISVTGSWRPSR